MKKLISFILTLTFILSVLPFSFMTYAASSGTCGENLTWELVWESGYGTLTISGTGDMTEAPWDSDSNWYIRNVIIENGVTSICTGAFYRFGITSVTIPDSVTSIGKVAFYFCSRLKSITIPDGVTSIGDNAFGYCTSLTSITIPDSVTSIGKWAFYATDLKSVTIPNGVTSIGEMTFYMCDKLKSVTIPNSVTSIGEYAFGYCSSLTNIYYEGSEEDWKNISIESKNNYLLDATIINICAHKNTTKHNAVPSTCKEQGHNSYTKCNDCGVVILGSDAKLPLANHKGGTADCIHKAKCAVCGKEYGNTNSSNHTGNTEIKNENAPSCEADGYTGDTYCKDCKTKIRSGSVISKTGHSFGNWTIVNEATENEEGLKERECSACGEKETKIIYAIDPEISDETNEETADDSEDITDSDAPIEDSTPVEDSNAVTDVTSAVEEITEPTDTTAQSVDKDVTNDASTNGDTVSTDGEKGSLGWLSVTAIVIACIALIGGGIVLFKKMR